MGRSGRDVILPLFVTVVVLLPVLSLLMIFPPSGGVSKYFRILSFNLYQSFLSASVSMIGGLAISWFLARRKLPVFMKSSIHAISKVSFVFPGISMAVGFFLLFGRNGILGKIFGIDILYTLPAVVMGHAFYNIPVVVYITGTLWEKMDGAIIESAELDGANSWKTFWWVEFPLLLPSMISSFLMAFLYSFTSFAVVMTIGGFRYRTLEVEIYSQISRLNFEKAMAATLLQLGVVSSLAILASLVRNPDFPYGEPKRKKPKFFDEISLLLPLLSISLPMFLSLISGILRNDAFKLLKERGWEFLGFGPKEIALYTFVIALASSFLTTAISIPAARSSARGKKVPAVFATIPVAFSSTVLAFSHLSVLIKTSLESLSILSLILIHSVISLPMSFRILESGWRAVPKELEEAAMVDGANKIDIFMKIDLPILISPILRSMTLSGAISMGELAAVLILSEGKFMTLSSAVFRLLSSRHVPEALALNSIFSLIVLTVFILGETIGGD